MHFSVAFASTTRRTYTKTKKGYKWRRFWRKDSRCVFLLYLSDVWRNFSVDFFRWYRVSVLTTRMSWILPAPLFQRSRMRRSTFWYYFSVSTGELLWWVPRSLGLYFLHETTWVDEVVITHVRGGEGFSCKVSNSTTDIVVASGS